MSLRIPRITVFHAILASSMILPASLPAQEPHNHADHSHDGHSHGEHDHSQDVIGFQLGDWKMRSFDNPSQAQTHIATLTRVGCDVEQASQGGMINIRYRCPEWKSMPLKTHDLADQWAKWFTDAGFDVTHAHGDPAFQQGPEAVEFRKVSWTTIHASNTPDEQELVKKLQQIGCEVRSQPHDGHTDLLFRAPLWRDIHLANHQLAEQWIGWLGSNGFETHHEH